MASCVIQGFSTNQNPPLQKITKQSTIVRTGNSIMFLPHINNWTLVNQVEVTSVCRQKHTQVSCRGFSVNHLRNKDRSENYDHVFPPAKTLHYKKWPSRELRAWRKPLYLLTSTSRCSSRGYVHSQAWTERNATPWMTTRAVQGFSSNPTPPKQKSTDHRTTDTKCQNSKHSVTNKNQPENHGHEIPPIKKSCEQKFTNQKTTTSKSHQSKYSF